jgi:molybdopterin synthase sulfur carrier subunit
MDINFYATLRLITGKSTVTLDLPDHVTVREMLEEVFRHYPPLRGELMTPENNLRGHVHVFVNGRDVPYLAGVLETPIAHTDRLDVFPAVAGG